MHAHCGYSIDGACCASPPPHIQKGYFFKRVEGERVKWRLVEMSCTNLDPLHQVSDETGNLVSELLGWDLCNLIADTFVSVEVQCETCVVLLNDFPGDPLHRLGSDTTLLSKIRRAKSRCRSINHTRAR